MVTKNACVVVKRVPAPKTGGLLAKIKALDAAAALQSTATYGILLRSLLFRIMRFSLTHFSVSIYLVKNVI